MTRRAFPIIFLYSVLAAACAATGTPAIYTPAAGSEIKVVHELRAAGGERVFVQDGKALPRRDIVAVNPYCQFSLLRTREELGDPIVIRPGSFTITRSYKQQDWSWAEGLQFAGDTSRSMSTVMELSSDDQREVTHLVCSRWGSINVGGWLTVAEMRSTLNGLVQIELAE